MKITGEANVDKLFCGNINIRLSIWTALETVELWFLNGLLKLLKPGVKLESAEWNQSNNNFFMEVVFLETKRCFQK